MGLDNPIWNLCHQFCIKKEVSVIFYVDKYYINLLFKLTVVTDYGYSLIYSLLLYASGSYGPLTIL